MANQMIKRVSQYQNNPKLVAPYYIDVKKLKNRQEDVQKVIYDVLKILLPCIPGMTISASDLNVIPLEGGLSNHLFLLTLPSNRVNEKEHPEMCQKQSFLIRISARQSETETTESTSVDQNKEMEIACHLAEHHIGPQCYGRFLNGRIEEYYPNMRTLGYSEISTPKFFCEIAKQMANFHLVRFSSVSTAFDILHELNGEIWSKVDDWIYRLYNLDAIPDENKSILDTIYQEWRWVKHYIRKRIIEHKQNNHFLGVSRWIVKARQFCSDIVFCHMDLQSLNILTPFNNTHQDSEPPLIHLIDFEYSGFNARAIDIANTFCECCDMNNLKAIYEDQYPTEEMQKVFFRQYIQSYSSDLSQMLDDNLAWNEFLTSMVSEVGKYTIVSHIGWAAWSLLQSIESTIDFDYIAYAKIRLEGYHFSRGRFWDSP